MRLTQTRRFPHIELLSRKRKRKKREKKKGQTTHNAHCAAADFPDCGPLGRPGGASAQRHHMPSPDGGCCCGRLESAFRNAAARQREAETTKTFTPGIYFYTYSGLFIHLDGVLLEKTQCAFFPRSNAAL